MTLFRRFAPAVLILLALAGLLEPRTEVADCHCIDVDVLGDSTVGGLVGNNMGTVTGCSTSGVVKGTGTVGGLALGDW